MKTCNFYITCCGYFIVSIFRDNKAEPDDISTNSQGHRNESEVTDMTCAQKLSLREGHKIMVLVLHEGNSRCFT